MTKNEFLGFLHAGDFKQLFLECGWNNPTKKSKETGSAPRSKTNV